MERASSWLITILMIMFWVFRTIVAISAQSGSDFGGFIAFDLNLEIILLFVTVLSFILIVKRKIIGAILYAITYGYYFWGYIFKSVLPIITGGSQLDIIVMQNLIISLVAIILSIFTVVDIFIDKIRKNKYRDNKTDWFFNDKKTDRNIDEKADKNQYRIY